MDLKKFFDSDPANTDKKQLIVKGAVIVGVIAAFFIFSSIAGGGNTGEQKEREKVGEFQIVDETHAVKSTFMGDVKQDVYGVHKDAQNYARESEQTRKRMQEQDEKIRLLEERLKGGSGATPFVSPANQNNPMGATDYPGAFPPRSSAAAGDPFSAGILGGGPGIGQGAVPPPPPPPVPQPPRKIYKPMSESEFFGSDNEKKEGGEASGKKERPTAKKISSKNLLSSGTIMKVRLLSGVDAPTLSKAKKQPLPLLMQVTDLGILPNRYKYDVEQCFVLGEGYGDLSSERVYVRITTLSCITREGKHIDGDLTGYVSGEDGKNGMRGRVVTKQGALLARSALAGFLTGIAKGMNMQNQSITSSALGSTIGPRPGLDTTDIMKMGVFSGANESAKRLADFYMDLADELTPVIEISANREVDVIVTELKDMVTLEDGGAKNSVAQNDSNAGTAKGASAKRTMEEDVKDKQKPKGYGNENVY